MESKKCEIESVLDYRHGDHRKNIKITSLKYRLRCAFIWPLQHAQTGGQ